MRTLPSAELAKLATLAALALSSSAVLCAAPVGDALQRPALQVAQPQQAVLLAAAWAGERIVAVGERGIVVVSGDRAAQWQQVSAPTSVSLTAVRFADSHHGWAVGHGGVVLATTDGGATWARQLDGKAAAALMLKAAQASGDAAALKEAKRLVADGADKPFLDLHFFDARRGIVVGAYNLAFITSDGGQTWLPIGHLLDNPKGLHLYAVRAQSDKVLIVGEQGLTLLSIDAGRSFKRLATPYKGSFFSAEWLGEYEWVLAGLRGQLWRSDDLGAHWSQVAVPAPVSFTASARGAGGALWLSNQAGGLFVLQEGKLQPLPGAVLPPIGGLLALGDGRLLALTVRGAVVVAVGVPLPAAAK